MSNRHGDAGEGTYDSVRERYRRWAQERPRRSSPSAIGMPAIPESAARMLALAAGVGLGVLLLALAVTAFVAAASWSQIGRGGAAVAYFLTGFFLTVAGLGCSLATLNHLFRVLARPPAHH